MRRGRRRGQRGAGPRAAAAVVLPFLLLAAGAGPLAAQVADIELDRLRDIRLLGLNGLLGGATAAVAAAVRREQPAPAFVQGFAGGALVYVGKRIAVDPRPGAGFLGRQTASVGGSLAGNAVAGRAALDRIALAAGPVRAYVGRAVRGVDWRLDVPAAGALVWALARGGEVDLAESLSTGAVVLRSDGEAALPGTIFFIRSTREDRSQYVLAHETVHILQYDQSFLFWGDPLEAGLARRFPPLRGPLEHLEFNLPVLTTAALLGFFVWEEHAAQPWEIEAIYLGRTR